MKKWLLLALFLTSQVHANHLATVQGKNGKTYYTGLIHKKGEDKKGLGKTFVELADCENLPENFDLRPLGVVPEIRDQGNCGSCWSFSKTGSLESAIKAGGGAMLDLSEQELVACDRNNYGCEGGNLNSNEYQIVKGQGKESDFPYTSGRTGSDGACKSVAKVGKGTEFVYVGASNRSPTEKELKCAIFKSHTIPWITVSANNNWGNFPSSEDRPYTSCGRGQTNHAVGVVGWKSINGKTYFIMKNSWGKDFGAKGYGLLALGCDSFGDEVAYIMTNAMPCKPPVVVLPAEVSAYKGVEVMVGVKDVQGVTYDWFNEAGQKIFSGPHLYVIVEKESVFKLIARTGCGKSESSVKIKVVQ